MAERKVLGKGLGALIPEIKEDAGTSERSLNCTIDTIQVNPHQPRKVFDQDKIEELARSIKEKGIIQPLLVKESEIGYELIAGERRLRAAKLAGITQVPIIVKTVSEEEQIELSLIENLQREDLNPIEEAEAYKKLMQDFEYTQQQLSQVLGKDRTTIANQIRLLKLPAMVKKALSQNEISMGHARCLLSISEPLKLREAFRLILLKGLSVRETEKLAKKLNQTKTKKKTEEKSTHLEAIRSDLMQHLGTQVKIWQKGKKGKIIIEFYSPEELEGILERIKGVDERERI
ncbi:MAG: ParB/RepB/Spo0J family partition protein [Thermodesulfobacteriota bacterium]|nr:ParB/RepB/Spo0J family partition protein [Thermodesulfobacteriota bacterium]